MLGLLSFVGAVGGGLFGDSIWYVAGRRHGFRVLRLLCRLSLSQDSCVRRTEAFFFKRGIRILLVARFVPRSEEHTSELQSLMRISYAVFCLKKKNPKFNKSYTQYSGLNISLVTQ